MQQGFVQLNDLYLEFKTFGAGEKVVFCFHGFSREAEDFNIFETTFGEAYTFVGVNFFLHGNSTFDKESRISRHPITKFEWLKIIKLLYKKFEVKKAILMGYSMGGRLCLNLVELAPELIEGLLLIAPDGLKLNPWYKFSSKTALGRSVFKLASENPNTLFPIAKGLVNIGVLPKKVIKLAEDNFLSEHQRQLVYNTWTASRLLLPNLEKVKANIKDYELTYHLIFGKYDKFIKPELAPFLTEGIEEYGHTLLIEAGHILLTQETVSFIKEKQIL
jgi:pimeloyl-ACP methyl ester carboxylesterase